MAWKIALCHFVERPVGYLFHNSDTENPIELKKSATNSLED